MKDGVKKIAYYKGIFDKYKTEENLDEWVDFPDIMWGLGFEMDCLHSYDDYEKNCGVKLKEPKNERDKKRNYLYVLEHSDRQMVGTFLFSYWRYLTHWSYGYTEYDVDFLRRVIYILEKKYE